MREDPPQGKPRTLSQDATGESLISKSAVAESTERARFTSVVTCFEGDPEVLLAIHRVPVRRHIRERTTSLAQARLRRSRATVIPRLRDEKAVLELASATLLRAAKRWCRISVNDWERRLPRLVPSSGSTHHQPTMGPPGAARPADTSPPPVHGRPAIYTSAWT